MCWNNEDENTMNKNGYMLEEQRWMNVQVTNNRKANNRNHNYDNGDSMKPNTMYEAYPIVRKT